MPSLSRQGASHAPPGRRATLDLKKIRRDPEQARVALARRGAGEDLDRLLELDERRRGLATELDEARAAQNKVSAQIKELAGEGGADAPAFAELRESSSELKRRLKELEPELAEIEERRDDLAASLPNLPDPGAPDGLAEEDAVVLREVGELPELGFEPRDHLELAEHHGWIDMEAAGRTWATW